jgi:hypothetical protein
MSYFIIADIEDVTETMLANTVVDEEALRYNIARSQVIIECSTYFEDCLAGYIKYTEIEIKTYIADNSADWIGVE